MISFGLGISLTRNPFIGESIPGAACEVAGMCGKKYVDAS
jgi:hypothetical protein